MAEIEIEPLPCFICGEMPKVGDFALMMTHKRGWTCLCPNKHYETETYYERQYAVEDWNRWVESEGFVFYDDDDDCDDDDGWEDS